MKSYRIIEIGGNFEIDTLYDSIISNPFNDKSGFIVDKKRTDFIEAVHFFKKIYQMNILSPIGEESSVTYHDYIKTVFKIISCNDRKFIIVINPPKESRVFNDDIKKTLPIFSFLKSINPEPIKLYEKLKQEGFNIDVTDLDISNININNRGLARITFSSDKDIYNDAINFVDNNKFIVKSLSMNINNNNYSGKCKISSNGNLKLTSYNDAIINAYLSIST